MRIADPFEIIDISPTVSNQSPVFPGDQPFERVTKLEISADCPIELSSLTMSPHVGAHADAPSHYARNADGIDRRPLSIYVGPCQVIEVNFTTPHLAIDLEALSSLKQGVSRVLFKTRSFPHEGPWSNDFSYFKPEVLENLAQQDVKLVGIDTPSVDPATSKILPSHQVLAREDMGVLEGLDLNQVSPGLYFLSAAPLKLHGCDAGPVRAFLLAGLMTE